MQDTQKVFNVGDVVRVISGGPKMTVSAIRSDDNIVFTLWFDSENHLQKATFVPETLDYVISRP